MRLSTKRKQAGKVRYVGFTGHKHPRIHLRMLEHDYPFDSVQMPLNCFDASYRSFERDVLPVANRRRMAALGMKSLGGGGEPIVQGAVKIEDALRYAMSLPVTTTISGIDSMAVLRQNVAIARDFRPLTAEAMQTLRDRCAAAAGDGHLEMYKSTVKYDAAAPAAASTVTSRRAIFRYEDASVILLTSATGQPGSAVVDTLLRGISASQIAIALKSSD